MTQKTYEMNDDVAKGATKVLETILAGDKKNATLFDADLYAICMEDEETARVVHEKAMESADLLMELTHEHLASGGKLFPGVDATNEAKAWEAIRELAATHPEMHPKLARIAELEKFKFLPSDKNAAEKAN